MTFILKASVVAFGLDYLVCAAGLVLSIASLFGSDLATRILRGRVWVSEHIWDHWEGDGVRRLRLWDYTMRPVHADGYYEFVRVWIFCYKMAPKWYEADKHQCAEWRQG